ncbi:hypothetical protein NMG60_11017048 [Bertholletia excelsa]
MQPEPGKMEQMITDFFAKCLQIILESRSIYVSSRNYSGEHIMSSPSSSSSSSSSFRPRDRRFNLALRDCPAAVESKVSQVRSRLEPMVVDVILVERPSYWYPGSCSPRSGLDRNLSSKEQVPNIWNLERDEFGCGPKTQKIIERWVVQYESQKSGRDGTSRKKSSTGTNFHIWLKKSILLLRSLYSMVRLLPAYKLFHKLNSSDQIFTFNLDHRVESFIEPFTHEDESEMQQFEFSPVETVYGRLCLSVFYRSSLSEVSAEPSLHMTPQLIPDYVGSPMAIPLKRIPSLTLPQGSPSSLSFGRRHSWSHDIYRFPAPSPLPSPSPTFSDSHPSISKPCSHMPPPTSLPRHLPEAPQFHKHNTNFDEYWTVPMFSPSPSPSPPYIYGSHVSKALLRSESAPLSISRSKLVSGPSLNNNQNLPPSPPFKGTKPSTLKAQRSSGLSHASSTVDKLFPFVKNETRRYPGVRMASNSSPQKSFSRSSSKLSFQDDLDDSDFSGPFIVEDDDIIYSDSSSTSFDPKGPLSSEPLESGVFQSKKSQDTHLGAVVRMLQKAPPLRQDINTSIILPETSEPASLSSPMKEKNEMSDKAAAEPAASFSLTSSGQVPRRTAADALEELEGYREMKDLLTRRHMRSHT